MILDRKTFMNALEDAGLEEDALREQDGEDVQYLGLVADHKGIARFYIRLADWIGSDETEDLIDAAREDHLACDQIVYWPGWELSTGEAARLGRRNERDATGSESAYSAPRTAFANLSPADRRALYGL